jgi:peptidoglycan/LPS O-acetylase OafA/YrhL
VTLPDALGVFGVLLILVAYAGATAGRLDPKRPLALVLNLVGALLILGSLWFDFNLSAVLMEGAWALVALIGLARLALRR